jgi:hypothetical protein
MCCCTFGDACLRVDSGLLVGLQWCWFLYPHVSLRCCVDVGVSSLSECRLDGRVSLRACVCDCVVFAEHTDVAVRHVLLRQGMLGVKVKIMLPRDPTGRNGPKTMVADEVTVLEPKE